MDEFRVCTSCGYSRGFHVFIRGEGGRHRIGLICPGCGQSFDIGWLSGEIEAEEPETREVFKSH